MSERSECFLKAEGYDHVAQGEAQSKKEAQTLAAWAFIDWLAKVDNLTPIENEHIEEMKAKAKGQGNSGTVKVLAT